MRQTTWWNMARMRSLWSRMRWVEMKRLVDMVRRGDLGRDEEDGEVVVLD